MRDRPRLKSSKAVCVCVCVCLLHILPISESTTRRLEIAEKKIYHSKIYFEEKRLLPLSYRRLSRVCTRVNALGGTCANVGWFPNVIDIIDRSPSEGRHEGAVTFGRPARSTSRDSCRKTESLSTWREGNASRFFARLQSKKFTAYENCRVIHGPSRERCIRGKRMCVRGVCVSALLHPRPMRHVRRANATLGTRKEICGGR